MTKPLRVDGIDISNWQKNPLDLGSARKAGCRFLFHKATEGVKTATFGGYQDPNYSARRAQAKRAGIPFGAYHFARPTRSSGVAQARYFLAYAKPAKGDMRPMLDLEDQAVAGWSPAKLTAWVKSFVGEVVKQTGVPPFIYTRFTLTDTFDCPLWVASYANDNRQPHVPSPWKTWTVWQFSDGVYGWPTSEPGVGHVDLNTMNGDPAKLTEVFRLGYAAPKPPAPKPPAPRPPAPKPPVPHVDPPIVPTPLGKQTTIKLATLNVNQFHSTAAAAADIKEAAAVADILMLEETSNVNVAKVLGPTWNVRQLLTNIAQKNITLAWRKSLHGVDGGEVEAAPGSHTTRSRWLDYEDIKIGDRVIRFGAGHREAFRDAPLWRPFDAAVRKLAADGKAKGILSIFGIDSNAATRKRKQAMEYRTGLHLHNVPTVDNGIDLFLSNLPNSAFANAHALAKGNSDHWAIFIEVTI